MTVEVAPSVAGADGWRTLDALLLVQAVYRCGQEVDWGFVVRTLKQHPCTAGLHPPDFFTQRTCAFKYQKLVEMIADEGSRKKRTDSQDMPEVVRIARQLFAERIQEVKKSIEACENSFKQLTAQLVRVRNERLPIEEMKSIQESWKRLDTTLQKGGKMNEVDKMEIVEEVKQEQLPSPKAVLLSASPRKVVSPTPRSPLKLSSPKHIAQQEFLTSPKIKIKLSSPINAAATPVQESIPSPIQLVSAAPVQNGPSSPKKMPVSSLLRSDTEEIRPPRKTSVESQSQLVSEDSSLSQQQKHWKKAILNLWNDIANHRFAPVFMNPVREEDAPGYFRVIRKPMDLTFIKNRIKDGIVSTTDGFHRDLLLMFQNALIYNGEESPIYEYALEMQQFVEQEIQRFRRTEALIRVREKQGYNSGSESLGRRRLSASGENVVVSDAESSSSEAVLLMRRK